MDDNALQRIVRSQTTQVPASRISCPSPEALESAAYSPRSDAGQRALLEHVTTCVLCRRDFDLLRTAHAAAPVVSRARIPRWIPALAAAVLIMVVSVVAFKETDTAMRGDTTPGPGITLLPPVSTAGGVILRWGAVAEAISYRVEVTDADGNVAFSAETADTVAITSTLRGSPLRWAVEARLLDGSVRTSRLDSLRTTR